MSGNSECDPKDKRQAIQKLDYIAKIGKMYMDERAGAHIYTQSHTHSECLRDGGWHSRREKNDITKQRMKSAFGKMCVRGWSTRKIIHLRKRNEPTCERVSESENEFNDNNDDSLFWASNMMVESTTEP